MSSAYHVKISFVLRDVTQFLCILGSSSIIRQSGTIAVCPVLIHRSALRIKWEIAYEGYVQHLAIWCSLNANGQYGSSGLNRGTLFTGKIGINYTGEHICPSFNILFKGTCFLSLSKCCMALKSQVEDEPGSHRKRNASPVGWGCQLGILLRGLGKTQITLT